MHQYKVKVHPDKAPVYLWGGAQVEIPFDGSLVLVMRNNEIGEPVTIKTHSDSQSPIKTIAVLSAGETFSVVLRGLKGILAECPDNKVDTQIHCILMSSFPAASA